MAFSYVGAGAVGTGANPVATVPTGVVKGDLLVIVAGENGNAYNTPSGWTLGVTTSSIPNLSVFYKFATSNSEANVTMTAGGTASASKAVMIAYRGIAAYGTKSNIASSTTGSVSTPSINTPKNNSLVISAYVQAKNSSNVATWTAPSSTNVRVNSPVPGNMDGILICDEIQATAGATIARTATSTQTESIQAFAITFTIPQDRYWVGGNGTWDSSTTNWSDTSGGTAGASAPTSTDNVIFDANSNSGTTAFTISNSAGTRSCYNFDASGLDGVMTINTGNIDVYGSWINHATNFISTINTLSFVSTLANNTINTNNVSIATQIDIGTTSTGEWTLNSNVSCTGTWDLLLGTLNLNNYNLTCEIFASSSSNASIRSIAFGTSGKVYCTGTDKTVVDMPSTNGFSYTGTSYIGMNGIGTSGQNRTLNIGGGNSTVFTESQAMNIYVLAGNDDIKFGQGTHTRTIDCTGFTGNISFQDATNTIYGGLILNSSMTYNENLDRTITFAATSGSYNINGAGITIGNQFIFNAPGATYTLTGNLIFAVNNNKITATLSLQNGTVNTSGYTVSIAKYSLTGGTLNMGASTFLVNDSTENAPWTRTSTTISAGTSTIAIPYTTAATYVFAGGGATYYNLSLTGTTGSTVLSITGNNTFNNITSLKTVTSTISFAASSTTTINNLTISGSSGNLVSLVSADLTTPTACTITATNSGSANYARIDQVNLTTANSASADNSTVINSNNWGITSTSKRWVMLTSGTSWTAPSDWASTGNEVHVIGGGGGGAGNIPQSVAGGAGGGGGGYVGATNVAITPSTAYTYTIGTAGAGGTGSTTSSTGGNGGTSSINLFAYPTFVASSTATATSSTTLNINKPTGTLTNDILVAFLDSDSTTVTWTGPAGWTEVSDISGRVAYYRTVGTSEGSSYTFTASGVNTSSGVMVAYRYAAIDVAGVWSGSSTNPAVASAITTTAKNTILLHCCASSTSAITISTPTGYTSIVSNETGSFPSYKVSYAQKASTGNTGTVSSTLSSSSARSILIALKSSTFQATGGTGGAATSTPSSTRGTGGTGSGGLSYTGGNGAAGAITGSLGRAGGGGGGAAGPNGNGGAGAVGVGSDTLVGDAAGGGGGGNGGGTNGSVSVAGSGGDGGNNYLGTGGATISGAAGTLGGGGAGGTSPTVNGGAGGSGIDIIPNFYGGGGGAGGGGTGSVSPGGTYGGGGGGAGTVSTSATLRTGGNGAGGAIFIGYTGSYIPPAPTGGGGNFFFLFM
jgi:hypothetical protein